jgi:hypothetical protein
MCPVRNVTYVSGHSKIPGLINQTAVPPESLDRISLQQVCKAKNLRVPLLTEEQQLKNRSPECAIRLEESNQ